MKLGAAMKHCLSLSDYSRDEVQHLVRLALAIKAAPAKYARALHGRWLLMLFQKTSTRTRLSFEIGMGRMGGRVVNMDWNTSNFAISPLEYEARYVSTHMDVIMARLKRHEDTRTLAGHSQVPVINGCDDRFHPCQALADLVTVQETAGTFEGQTLAYVGIHNNVANSLVLAGSRVGLKIILVTPEVNPSAHDEALLARLESEGAIERTLDLRDAAARSNFVYTDTWVDMEFFNDPAYAQEKARRIEMMQPYQLNARNLGDSQAYILHDMPIHPGYEIDAALVDSPRSIIYQQAENRLYAQQALMLYLLGEAPL